MWIISTCSHNKLFTTSQLFHLVVTYLAVVMDSKYSISCNHQSLKFFLGFILYKTVVTWWRHQMETFSALLAIWAGNSLFTGEFPTQRPVTRSFDVFFDLRLNKRLSKQSWGWWFETPLRSVWRHCNELGKYETTQSRNTFQELCLWFILGNILLMFYSLRPSDASVNYSIMMLVRFGDLSQSDCSKWVMWQVKDPQPRPGWDGCLTWEKVAFIKCVIWLLFKNQCEKINK